MKKSVKVRPSKFISILTFVLGLCFVLFGIFYVIPVSGVFGLFWTIGSGLITIYHGINAFTKKGISLYKIDIDDK